MPYVAPTLRSQGGMHGDSNADTITHTIQANAGDLVIITMLTSDYLRTYNTLSGGGIGWASAVAADVEGYGDAYIHWGISPTTQTFNVTATLSGGNYGADYERSRFYVFGDHDGVGAVAARRGTGNNDLQVAQQRAHSAIVFTGVDWFTGVPRGTPQTQAGPWVETSFFLGGAGGYWDGYHPDAPNPGTWWVGYYGINARFSNVAIEVRGRYVDTDDPSVPGNVDATANDPYSATVSWTASTDDVGVQSYRVMRDGQVVADGLTSLSWRDTGLDPLTAYSYTVSAVDAAGNRSAESAAALVVTPEPLSVYKVWDGSAWNTSYRRKWVGDSWQIAWTNKF